MTCKTGEDNNKFVTLKNKETLIKQANTLFRGLIHYKSIGFIFVLIPFKTTMIISRVQVVIYIIYQPYLFWNTRIWDIYQSPDFAVLLEDYCQKSAMLVVKLKNFYKKSKCVYKYTHLWPYFWTRKSRSHFAIYLSKTYLALDSRE